MGVRHYPGQEKEPVKMVICIKCEKEKEHHAKGMCTICYARIRNKKRAEANNLFI